MKKGIKIILLLVLGIISIENVQASMFSAHNTQDHADSQLKKDHLNTVLIDIVTTIKEKFDEALIHFSSAIIGESSRIIDFNAFEVKAFESYTEDQLNIFKNSCKSAGDAAMMLYYREFPSTGTDPVAQKIQASIKLAQDSAEYRVALSKNMLMNGDSIASIGDKLSEEIDDYTDKIKAEFNAQKEYFASLENPSGWEMFIRDAKEFFGSWGDELLVESVKLVGNTVTEWAEEAGKEIIENLVEKKDDKKDDKKDSDDEKKDDSSSTSTNPFDGLEDDDEPVSTNPFDGEDDEEEVNPFLSQSSFSNKEEEVNPFLKQSSSDSDSSSSSTEEVNPFLKQSSSDSGDSSSSTEEEVNPFLKQSSSSSTEEVNPFLKTSS